MTRESIPPKPRHLQQNYGDQFQDQSIAAAYQHRPAHSDELIPVLLDRIPDSAPRAVLDIGCGTGETARLIAPHVDSVDAVDPFQAMLQKAQALADPTANINWIHDYFEAAPLNPPYGLAVAAESLGT